YVTACIFIPVSPSRFTFSAGTSRMEPTNTANATKVVTQRETRDLIVQVLTGRKIRANQFAVTPISVSANGAGWYPGMRLFRINQYANTGTIVKATSVDPIMARTTVSANGRKSSPAMPSTNRMGTNTMTVTNVEEITAEETSPV